MREWNAEVYHKVSSPQLQWGLAVLERLSLQGSELVLDVGCGTGRLTEKLLERLPRGSAVGIDMSANMLETACTYLRPRFAARIRFLQADAAALPFHEAADAIFSTATIHWVLDHDGLFASLHTALKPGGRLVAQCGGGRNIERIHSRCLALMQEPQFASYYTTWSAPWTYADAATTAARLERAGFVDIGTDVVPAPVVFDDAASFREFVTHVIARPFLAPITVSADQDRFMTRITELAAQDCRPFELDYWRLNMEARRSG